MGNRVRWGVVGSGGIARRRTIPEGIVPAANAQLVAVYGSNRQTNAEVAQAFQAKACDSLEDLLATDLDAIYVATPVHLHHEQVARCLRAGKHVLCEKPLALTVQDAQDMVALARERKVQFGVALMMRLHSQHQEALKIIRSGKLGIPVFGRAQLSCWYPPLAGAWRQDSGKGGGGSLVDLGVHCIDLLEMFFGPVASVTCHTASLVQNYETEDSAVATLVFESGALGVVDTLFCIPDESSRNVLELYGSQGSILAHGTIGQGSQGEMVFYPGPQSGGYDAHQTRGKTGGIEIAPPPVNTYQAEIEEFSQAILDGRVSELDASAGMHSQRVLAACYESARTLQSVRI